MASQHGDETNNHHVVGISGSLRKASANSGLLRAAEQVVPQGMDIAVFYPRDIPFYNGDVEAKGDPGPVIALKEAIRAADAVLFATPEYNYGTSGVLKNVVDWASRDGTEGSLMGKPGTIIGAGGRAGTARAQMQLRETLAETGAVVMVKPGVLVTAYRPAKFDSEGNLIDEETRQMLQRHLEEFAKWIDRLRVRPELARFFCEMDVQPTQA